jgi:hypothetical protein
VSPVATEVSRTPKSRSIRREAQLSANLAPQSPRRLFDASREVGRSRCTHAQFPGISQTCTTRLCGKRSSCSLCRISWRAISLSTSEPILSTRGSSRESGFPRGSAERIAWGDWGEAVTLELAYKYPRTGKRIQIRQAVRIARHESFELRIRKPPAAGRRGKRDSYGLDIHLNIRCLMERQHWRSPTSPSAGEGALSFLGAHQRATSPSSPQSLSGNRAGEASLPPRRDVGLYSAFTGIIVPFAAGAFGSVTTSTPFLNVAVTLLPSTAIGSRTLRRNAP